MNGIFARIFRCFLPFTLAAVFLSADSFAQFTNTVPLSQQNQIFNAVTTAQTSGCLANQGQNIWFSNYIISGNSPTLVQYRLEYSYNSDAATCTTGTWFAMSDDAENVDQGAVIGIGPYPFVRANLVSFTASGGTFTSFYTTSSASPSDLYGFYNPSQRIRKIVFSNQSSTSNGVISTVAAPFGSSAGILVLSGSGTNFSSASISVNGFYDGIVEPAIASFTLNGNANNGKAFFMPATPASSLAFTYLKGATGSGTFNAYWIALPPHDAIPPGMQPPTPQNTESTNGVNNPVSVTLSPQSILQSVYIYSISGRCNAGTAQLTIKDGSTTIWSSGPTEVSTSTFKFQWFPGLNGSLSPGDFVTAALSACGAGNTGTLDVQASVF